jgi:DNA replication regulator DPB11
VPAPPPPPPNPPLQPRLQQLPAPEAMNQDLNAQLASSSTQEADEEAEVASVKRIPAVTLQLWETLLKPRGFEINGGKLVRSPTKSQADVGEGQMSPLVAKTKGKGKERDEGGIGSVISSFKRVDSFAPPPVTTAAPRQPFRRIASIIEPEDNPKPSRSPSPSRSNPRKNVASSSKTGAVTGSSNLLFSGLKFKTLGEAKCQNVKTEIEGCGGRMVNGDEEADVDFIVVRLVRYARYPFSIPTILIVIRSGSKIYRDEADEHERPKYRTECWLERCMFEERICLPDEHVSFTPLTIDTPVPGKFSKLTLSCYLPADDLLGGFVRC